MSAEPNAKARFSPSAIITHMLADGNQVQWRQPPTITLIDVRVSTPNAEEVPVRSGTSFALLKHLPHRRRFSKLVSLPLIGSIGRFSHPKKDAETRPGTQGEETAIPTESGARRNRHGQRFSITPIKRHLAAARVQQSSPAPDNPGLAFPGRGQNHRQFRRRSLLQHTRLFSRIGRRIRLDILEAHSGRIQSEMEGFVKWVRGWGK